MIRRMLLALLFTWCAAAPVSAQTTVTPSRTFVPSMTVPTTGWIGLGPAAGRIVFTDAATDTIGLMTADVGIGTTTPGALLHAVTSTTALGTAIFSQASADADAFELNFRKARGTIAAPTIITTADELGGVRFRGYDGSNFLTAGEFRCDSSGTIAVTRVPGNCSIWTATDAAPSVLTQRMTVTRAGNVGIGTTAPNTQLDILTTNDASGGIRLQSSLTDATNKNGRIKVGHYTNAEEPVTIMIGTMTSGTNIINFGGGTGVENAATQVGFYTAGDTTTLTGTERMSINSSGNIGIGTIAQAVRLHVDTPSLITAAGGANAAARFGTSAATAKYLSAGQHTTAGNSMIQAAETAGGTAQPLLLNPFGGNVGINTGTTAPDSPLHVISSDSRIKIQTTGADSDAGITLQNDARSWRLATQGSVADAFIVRDATGGVNRLSITPAGLVEIVSALGFGAAGSGRVAQSATAPTIGSGFGTTPSIAASNGTVAFTVNVGTGGTASSGVITMPAATTGWNCHVVNRTAVAANTADRRTVQTATTTTSVTVQNQVVTLGTAAAWAASNILALMCAGY